MKIVRDESEVKDTARPQSWGVFASKVFAYFGIYAIANHAYYPLPIAGRLFTPWKIAVVHVSQYFLIFSVVYLAISIPCIVVTKVLPSGRNTSVLRVLNATLLPTALVLASFIYIGWWMNSNYY